RAAGDRPLDVGRWRRDQGALLRSARRVVAPSADTAARIAAMIPGVTPTVVPHPDPLAWSETGGGANGRHLARRPGCRRIVVVGGLSVAKGRRVLERVARRCCDGGLPLEFVVMGD